MKTINGNTEPDKRSYTPFSAADRIQMLGTTSEGVDNGPILFDENKISPEELRQIVGDDVDLIPAADKLSKLSSLPDASKISRFGNKDNIPEPVDGGYENSDNSRVRGSGIACHADEGFDDLGYDVP